MIQLDTQLPKCALPTCTNRVKNKRKRFCSNECSQESQRRPGSRRSASAENNFVEGLTVAGDTATVTKSSDHYVKTLPDLIRVCQIDTTEWNVIEFSCKASQQASVPRATRPDAESKWTRPTTKPVLTQMFHVSAKLRRKSVEENTCKAIAIGLLEDIRAEVKRRAPAIIKHRFVNSGFLFEFSPFDLHMGKLAWGEETVTDYDSAIATDLFNVSLDFLLSQALKVADGKLEKILCVFGNDAFHTDSKRGQTTAGTPMDVDSRYVKVFRRNVAIHSRAIELLRQIAPVDCCIVPGNHDEQTSFLLGEVLNARFHATSHVTIDNNPRLRKYYEFGTNLFGFAHGDAERVSELPLLMAREQSERWHRCQSREWHIGHKHISEKFEVKQRIEQDLFSDKGIRIRRLTSLSAHDFWHTKYGYMDRRACESFVFHKTAGFTSHHSFNVEHFSGKALTAA